MKLFTFIVDRAGGTYLSQFNDETLAGARDQFVKFAMTCEHLSVGLAIQDQHLESDMLAMIQGEVPIPELVNVHGTSYLDAKDESWIIHIVETALPEIQDVTP